MVLEGKTNSKLQKLRAKDAGCRMQEGKTNIKLHKLYRVKDAGCWSLSPVLNLSLSCPPKLRVLFSSLMLTLIRGNRVRAPQLFLEPREAAA